MRVVLSMEFETDLKIGTLGEQVFSTWCTSAQLGSNRSLEEDRTGWDHQVEFPYVKTDLPRDKQLSPIQCRIQVKSTQRKDRSWSIKASVLKRLIDYSYPAFVLFLEFSKDVEPVVENAFLVHIDKSIIEKTLKKIRRNDTLKSRKELYDVKVSISYNKKHLLPEISGISFRNTVLKYVLNGNITTYQEKKRHLLDTVGYDESGYKLMFDAIPIELDKHIISCAIGASESIDVKNIILLDNRFNLNNGSVEVKDYGDAKLTISPNIKDSCQLCFKDSDYSPSINFDADFISLAQVFSKNNKLMFRAALFSIELDEFDTNDFCNAKIHLTIDKSVSLDEVIKMFKLFHPDNVNKELLFEVGLTKAKKTLKFKVKFNYELPDLRDAIDAINVLKNSYEVDGNTQTSVDEVYIEKDRLVVLANLIQNKIEHFRFNLKSRDGKTPDEIKTPLSLVVKIGSKAIGLISLLYGRKDGGEHYQVFKSEVLLPLVFHEGMPERCIIEKLEEEALSKFERDINLQS
jgi:hypothetical protein